jgi:hypothetical protein
MLSFIVMENIYHNCDLCEYKTKMKYNLKRHQNAIHNKRIIENVDCKNNSTDRKNNSTDCKNNNIECKNNNIECKNNNIECKNNNTDNKCSKCSKILSSKYYLEKHLLICKGVSNILECHLCHKVFAFGSSKSKHLKTCKEKSKEQTQLIQQTINNNNNNSIILNDCNNNTINNNYNLNLCSYNQEESKIDFDIKHLENNNIVYKLYTIEAEDAFRIFYRKLFENKNNQMIIKKNLRHSYSNVHTGSNVWQKLLDDYIYDVIMKFISETLLIYINDNTINKENNKYKNLRDYTNYMATKGYSYYNTKEIEKSYKNHIKSLKYLFNTFNHN